MDVVWIIFSIVTKNLRKIYKKGFYREDFFKLSHKKVENFCRFFLGTGPQSEEKISHFVYIVVFYM